MRLTDPEKAMLDGAEGRARQKAMELLVRYGEALGAERLIETNNVCTTTGSATPFMRDYAARGFDAIFSEFNLDSREVVAQVPVAGPVPPPTNVVMPLASASWTCCGQM